MACLDQKSGKRSGLVPFGLKALDLQIEPIRSVQDTLRAKRLTSLKFVQELNFRGPCNGSEFFQWRAYCTKTTSLAVSLAFLQVLSVYFFQRFYSAYMTSNQVIVVDNYFTGSKDNLKKWIGHPRFELIRHDITESLLVEVDQIYHLACPASPIFYKYNPVKTIKTNVIGTLNMLGLAKRLGARILLTSTSEVYGDPLVHPQPESYWGNVNPIGVRSCYDEGKRVAETLMFDYHRQHGIEIRVARIFNTYGPRMNIDDGRVVSNFIAQALRGEPLTVQSPGTQTRSFCYVSDLVDGLIRLMEGSETGPINLGNPGEFTMLELAETVKELINPNVEIKTVENTPDDPRQRKPDITKATELLGWVPKVKLRDGLPLMEEDFRLRLGVDKKN
ncbi:UDP-glucuronic acid decarboxylase 5, partial [Mucuna pruriens]